MCFFFFFLWGGLSYVMGPVCVFFFFFVCGGLSYMLVATLQAYRRFRGYARQDLGCAVRGKDI